MNFESENLRHLQKAVGMDLAMVDASIKRADRKDLAPITVLRDRQIVTSFCNKLLEIFELELPHLSPFQKILKWVGFEGKILEPRQHRR